MMKGTHGTKGVKSVEGRNKHAKPMRGMNRTGNSRSAAPGARSANHGGGTSLPVRGTKRRM